MGLNRGNYVVISFRLPEIEFACALMQLSLFRVDYLDVANLLLTGQSGKVEFLADIEKIIRLLPYSSRGYGCGVGSPARLVLPLGRSLQMSFIRRSLPSRILVKSRKCC